MYTHTDRKDKNKKVMGILKGIRKSHCPWDEKTVASTCHLKQNITKTSDSHTQILLKMRGKATDWD